MGIIDRLRGTGPEPQDGPSAPPRAILAAAMPMSGPGVKAVNRGRAHQTQEQWQREAWYYWDVTGELRSPTTWIANAVSLAGMHATTLDPDTGEATGPSDNANAIAVVSRTLGGATQRAGLLRLLALCWQVAGEAWIIIRPTAGGKPDEWRVLSGNKVQAKGERWQYTDPMNGSVVILGPQDRLIRVWCPHPDDQAKADSSVRSALPILREIEKASQNIAARLDSRIATNGLLVLADELSLTGQDFMAEFMSSAELGLANPGQASSQVPFAFNAPAEFIANGGAVAHIDLGTAFDASVVELRDNGRDRLAQTLDVSKSTAQGTQNESNHWSAWQVSEDDYKIFIAPLLEAIGDPLTEHYVRPALRRMGMTAEQADQLSIGWDVTAIVARPDARETLESLYEKILISDEYMLTENGVTVDAMPAPDERTRRMLEKLVLGAPTLLADPNVAAALGLDIEVQPAAAGVDATVSASGELEPPEPEPVPNTRSLPATQGEGPPAGDVPEGLVAAAELIVYDALRRAGGRLLTNQNRGQFKATPRHELHTVISAADPLPLMEGSFEFTDKVAEAFNVYPTALDTKLRLYVKSRLFQGLSHDRAALREALR